MIGDKFVYFGNLFPHEPQYESGQFVGLALTPRFDRDIPHDARANLPFADDSVAGFQSQDVFEHVEREKIPAIFDDIYRCMRPGAVFRLSLPDYNSPLLRRRSVYDHQGNVLYDVAMGGALKAQMSGGIETVLPAGGDVHLWFPTYHELLALVIASDIRRCHKIAFHHHWVTPHSYVMHDFDQSVMPVSRTPPKDMRADGKPVSIVVDFIK
ncbi:MAG: class I SAM-dependent methyltransferase [Porphyrobacter sp. IPPAS B-1204]|nr:MAG: class I SAM-dependent methyltransferase [Porphyrobacter sp. IPPAS B-1204]